MNSYELRRPLISQGPPGPESTTRQRVANTVQDPKTAEALKPYVHQQLDELGEPDLDFTGSNEG